MSEKQQKLVFSIIEFLNQSIQDGTVKADDKEGLEVAIQCIGEAFGIDETDQQQVQRLSVHPATLQTIFDVFLKTRANVGSSASAQLPSTLVGAAPTAPSTEEKVQAEQFKQSGNTQMSGKNYAQAIESYTKAIALDCTNPVYYSNRAAAYSSKNDHISAVADAEKAIEVDPSFVKAYSRLGHAQYSLGEFKAAVAAFTKGLELDPSNANLNSGLMNAKARIEPEDDGPPDLIPDDSFSPSSKTSDTTSLPGADSGGMADMLRNMGGGGGGMPDLAGLMNNPRMMQMAQQMMANGGLESLMSNPAIANMMNRVQSGGGMPSMEELMSDPTMRNLASQFGAGGRSP